MQHSVTFDKVNREIRINGKYAGYCDPSETMEYSYRVDDQGGEVITVTEILKLSSPLPDGTTEMRIPIFIFRPWIDVEMRRDAKKLRAEREAAAQERIAKWRAKCVKNTEIEMNEGLEGQTQIGGFF